MDTILQRLTELDEVHNAILIGKDGLIVASILRSEDEEMLGALSAAAFGSINHYTTQVNSGDVRYLIIETKAGVTYMQEAGDLILMVIAQGTSNPGRIRLEMKKACRQLLQKIGSF